MPSRAQLYVFSLALGWNDETSPAFCCWSPAFDGFGVAPTVTLLSLLFPDILEALVAAGIETCRCLALDSFYFDSPPEFFVWELLAVPVAVTTDLPSRAVLPLLGRDWKLGCLLSVVPAVLWP